MRVLVAPDKFKGGATARQAARALARGVRRIVPEAAIDLCPLADGGEGTAEVLAAARGGSRQVARVTGPLGEPVEAAWVRLADGTAVLEMAAAAGLELVPPERRDPTRTTTFGVGELLARALDAPRVVVGVGGSATVDGGAGAVQALGVALDPDRRPARGGDLSALRAVDPAGRDPRLGEVELLVACDVGNPLLGAEGAAAVYAPQKGASPAQVRSLERGLRHWAGLCGGDPEAAGAGAAGGLGYGLAACCGARLVRGIDLVLDVVGFAERLDVDLVLTGEGRLDAQTGRGKVIAGVVAAARSAGVPVIALAGEVEPGADDLLEGIGAAMPIADGPRSLEEALRDTEALLEQAAARAVRLLRLG